MHGRCSVVGCPVCSPCVERESSIEKLDTWLRMRLTVVSSGMPHSPWWEVEQSNGDCYRKLRGNLRHAGYYDRNPDVH